MATKTKADLQSEVKKRVALGIIFGLSVTYIAWKHAPLEVPTDPSMTARLVFALRWLALSMVPILLGVRVSLYQFLIWNSTSYNRYYNFHFESNDW